MSTKFAIFKNVPVSDGHGGVKFLDDYDEGIRQFSTRDFHYKGY